MFTKSGIYKIINSANGEFYIGSANNFKRRFNEHAKGLRNNNHKNAKLQNGFNKYGTDAFEFQIIEIIENATKELLETREQYYLDTLKPFYNIAPMATNCLGIKRSEETKKKQSLLKLGKPQSEAHRKAIGDAHRGSKHNFSDEAKANIRKAHLGNTWGLGYKHDEETKLKISQTHKGKPKSKEHVEKMRLNSIKQYALVLTEPPIEWNK